VAGDIKMGHSYPALPRPEKDIEEKVIEKYAPCSSMVYAIN
jgi:hypothetical protein